METRNWQRIAPIKSEAVRPLFAELTRMHLNVAAVLENTCPGEIWADTDTPPRTACITSGILIYLAGDPENEVFNQAIHRRLPRDRIFVLICDPEAWSGALDRILDGTYAVRATSRYLELQESLVPDWQAHIPDGYTLRYVDAALLSGGLENHEALREWITDEWNSIEDFLERGAGTCLISEETIASWSLMDYASGTRCEIGIETDHRHRRCGLGTLAAAATTAGALDRGYSRVGWHCWANNLGSQGVARNVGFELAAEYDVFINHWAAQNVTDMTQEEFRAFAQAYERAFEAQPPTSGFPHIVCAKAWALSHDRSGSFRHLNKAIDLGWLKGKEHLREIWPEFFWNPNLEEIPEWQAMLDRFASA